MTKQLVVSGLGYAGLLPFILTAYLLVSGTMVPAGNAGYLFVSYSAVILAFIGGSLWGWGMILEDSPSTCFLLIVSNLVALMVWMNLFLGVVSPKAAIAGLTLAYLIVLILELRFANKHSTAPVSHYEVHYVNLRVTLTMIVVLLHLLVFLFSQ